jgi:HD superfamily phosphohydrolase
LWFIVTLRPETKVMPHIPATRKIINDPVHGFITVPFSLVFDIMEHPHFQRLRRIKQLGLTHLVYPGAMHTRFIHSLGCSAFNGIAN